MSYPQTVTVDYLAQGGGGGGITLAEFQAYKQELDALVAAATEINDSVTSATTTWSSTRIAGELAEV